MTTKLKYYIELVAMKHTIFSLPFILIAMMISSKLSVGTPWFGWRLLLLALLSALFARNFAMAFNRYIDRDVDRGNPRTKDRPSVDGRLSSSEQLVFLVGNAIAFLFVSYLVNILAFWVSIPMLVILALYSYFKRFSALAHLVLGLTLSFAPIAGEIAVSASISLWNLYLSIGVMFWVAGFDLLYSLQDIDFDKRNNLHSVPSRYGTKATLLLSVSSHFVALLFWLLFTITLDMSTIGYCAVLFSFLMLSYEHYLVRKDMKKIDKAFFVVNGYLGMVFLLIMLIEVNFGTIG